VTAVRDRTSCAVVSQWGSVKSFMKTGETSIKPQRTRRNNRGKSEHQKVAFSICSVLTQGLRGMGAELKSLIIRVHRGGGDLKDIIFLNFKKFSVDSVVRF